MKAEISPDITSEIIDQATEFGASLAGIADVEAVKNSPSHLIYGKLDAYKTVGNIDINEISPGEVVWPENAKSVIVIAVVHSKEEPELDWWMDGYTGGTHGNRMLMSINDKLSQWMKKEKGIQCTKLPYHIEHGGIFLKDAAVLAGLGCIGKNNMVVTPDYGPRVRLRAMFTDAGLEATGPVDFDPCESCNMPCRRVCPQEAFQKTIYPEEKPGMTRLPARAGAYSRYLCNMQMERDYKNSELIMIEGHHKRGGLVKYCRRCELACPVGEK
ncbi:MAG: epoxyqueuosine reductase [Thermodesulfobacteriota bacterium]